jgi:hypothetical protein
MGFLDKVKDTAQQVAADAKKGAGQVKDKVEQGQTRKRADELAKQLGYLVVRERSGGSAAGGEADRLVEKIVDLERQLESGDSG